MVILVAGVEAVQQLQIEIPGLHGRGARLEPLEGARGDGHGRKSGRAAEAFLGAAIGNVDAVFVHQYGHATEGGDAIGDRQRSGLVGRLADRLGLIVHAGRRFGLHKSDHVRLLAADEVANLLRVVRLAPSLRELHHFGALTAGHLTDTVGEKSVGEQRKLAARLGKIGHGRFHAGAARAGNGQTERVFGGVSVPQEGADLIGDLEEVGIQVPDDILRHGGVDARGDHAGSRSEKQTFWGL